MSLIKSFLFLSGAFILGVFLGSFFNDWPKILFLILAAIGAAFFIFKKKKLAVLILVFTLGFFWIINSNNFGDFYILNSDVQETVLEGQIVDEIKIYNKSIRFVFEIKKMGDRFVKDKILITAGRYPEYEYGDVLKIAGKLKEPENGSFDIKTYLAKDDIYTIMDFPRIELLKRGGGNLVYKLLFAFKNKFENVIEIGLSEPSASLMKGILFGDRLPADLKEAFVKTGVAHITALSGFNISIIALFLFAIFDYFMISRTISFYLSIIFIVLFTLMTGASASVVRAAIMGILFIMARKTGRPYTAIYALIFAGVIMVVLNPKVLVFDLGFQLSFLSSLGLIYLYPILENKFSGLPDFISIKEYLGATLASQIFVLPLLVYRFGQLSLIAPLANILILPAVPLSMLLGFLGGFVGMVSITAAKFIFLFAFIFLEYMIKVAQFLASFSYSAIYLGSVSIIFVIFYYFALAVFIKNSVK